MTRLIAFDLDGTLFGPDSRVAPSTLNSLQSVAARGHHLLAVTGRSFRTAEVRLRQVESLDRIVGSNGAVEYQRSASAVVWSDPVQPEHWARWMQQISAVEPSACYGWETPAGIGFDERFLMEAGGADQLERGGDPTFQPAHCVYKLYVRSPRCSGPELQARLRSILGGEASIATSGAPFIEITAAGVDKASGLSRVADDLGASAADTIVFGDNHNDVPMFEWAGMSVAMGNAVPELAAIATRQTAHHAEHGVATMLDSLMKDGTL